MAGWIKLHRCIEDNWVWKDKPFSKGQAWIDMLMLANHEPHKLKTRTGFVEIERGSFHTEERSLMARWGWSNSKVRNFMRSLEEEKMIEQTVKKSTTGKSTEGTTVKVLNYCTYQDKESSEKSNGKSTKEAARKQRESSEKAKQEILTSFVSKEGNKFYAEFVSMSGEEHQKLLDKFGVQETAERIERLNEWYGKNPANIKKSPNPYFTILAWARRDGVQSRRSVLE